ncbi:hypothetical protein NXC24_CH03163 [Rhizobium sp. NXC24]|nr:hypothetical protein NXC24_CH03163 [Rhizobium sp. NXC24]
MNFESKHEVENILSAAQTQMILRFMLASMAETWEMIRRPNIQRLLLEINGDVEADGKEAHRLLKRHFGNNNVLHRLRNSVVYHYPDLAALEKAFSEVPDDEDWAWYVSHAVTNGYYYLSDLVISSHILEVMGERNPELAFGKLMDEVVPVAENLLDFLAYVMRAIVTRHFGAEMLSPMPGTGISISGVPNMNDVSIPFFTIRDQDI